MYAFKSYAFVLVKGSPIQRNALLAVGSNCSFKHKTYKETFNIGSLCLDVESNVYFVELFDIAMLKAFSIIKSMSKNEFISLLREYIDAEEIYIKEISNIHRCLEIIDRLKKLIELINSIENWNDDQRVISQLAEILLVWDKTSNKFEESCEDTTDDDSRYIPIKIFIRKGLFLPAMKNIGGKVFPPGCYVIDSNDDATIYHELAHAAMAVNRKKGALEGCRWMEEAFAEYLMGIKLGFGKCTESWCELDVYVAWNYLKNMDEDGKTKDIEKLLRMWLSSSKVGYFCCKVLEIRKSI